MGEDVQARAIASEFAAMDEPFICGAAIWCWADHLWSVQDRRRFHKFPISPYGVLRPLSPMRLGLAGLETAIRVVHGRGET